MIQKILDEVSAMEQNANRGVAVKIDWWRSSGLGSCMRGRFLERLVAGMRPQYDARTMGVFAMGNITEAYVVSQLKKHPDWLILEQGEIQDPNRNVRGHFDFLMVHLPTDKWYLGECKSKNSKAFSYDLDKNGASPHYKMQVSSYQDLIQKYGFLFTYDPNLVSTIGFLKTLPYSPTAKDEIVAKEYLKKVQDYFINKGAVIILEQSQKNPNDARYVCSVDNTIIKKQLEYSSILYVSKDDQRMMEFVINAKDVNLSTQWEKEVDILNMCWSKQEAPPMYPAGAWQNKYCQYCKAGLCQKLDDPQVVKNLFVLSKK